MYMVMFGQFLLSYYSDQRVTMGAWALAMGVVSNHHRPIRACNRYAGVRMCRRESRHLSKLLVGRRKGAQL